MRTGGAMTLQLRFLDRRAAMTALITFVLVTGSCAGTGHPPASVGVQLTPQVQRQTAFIRSQLAELEKLPRPSAADPKMWRQLKASLKQMLESKLDSIS